MKEVKVAGKELKRERTKSGKTEVNGHAVFENGKLTKPKVEQEIADFVEKKKQLTKPSRKVEDLPDEDAKWYEYITINNVKNKQKREEIKQMIETVLGLPNVMWSKVNDADFVAKTNNRIILKICALSRPATWSVMCPSLGPNICRYEFDEVVSAILKAHAMFYKQKSGTAKKIETPQKSISGNDAVAILKAKVEGLSKTSKGFIKPKEVSVTDPAVKKWLKQNQYSAIADRIMLNRVP